MNDNNKIPISKLSSILNKNYQFVDLRDPYEYKKLHLQNFINIPFDQFDLNHYHFSKKEPLILLCYSGRQSQKLADTLRKQGYQAYSIEGGFYTIMQQKQTD